MVRTADEMAERAVSWWQTLIHVAGAGALALSAGGAEAYQFAGASASGYAEASSQLCGSVSSGTVGSTRYACNQNNTGRVFVEDQETTDAAGEEVHVSGQGEAYGYFVNDTIGIIEIPGSPLATEATAHTNAFSNHAFARTVAFSSVTGGEDIIGMGDETRYNDSTATAEAWSQWAEEITFTGGTTLGQGAMRFAIDGAISVSSYGDPFIEHTQPEGASVAFEAFNGNVGANEMIFALDVFDSEGNFVTGGRYLAYSNGNVSDELTVFVPFQYGETYTFVGTLGVYSYGYGLNNLSCEIVAGGGQNCSVQGSEGTDGTLDFANTVSVESLTLPVGASAVGTGGATLPFPILVPEPASAGLLALGVAALAWRRERRTH